ncbi:flavodoxin family protein [Peptoniphilus sp. MSJ-1]|uniref:Flavodoxin family protein n=1 Tax=Peptoniphilus ovalis TaxID=2841503 RepID=A0ABS6FGY8_9FIRM|nr:flavodoxin family protein [Peptoniphilus ovalis]MBU5669441.1 flavodoxin family protein [Peptoniphilus ovalis]
MKGLIIYSSKTGNTKHMAEVICQEISNTSDVDLVDIKEYKNMTESHKENYDFILLGAWIDRGTLENKAMKLFKSLENQKIGLFATLGAMPDSEHGRKVIKNLEELLKDKESLGQYICPGLVDEKMIEKLKGITGMVVPKHVKEKMIETSIASRYATEEELEEAGKYFKEKIEEFL